MSYPQPIENVTHLLQAWSMGDTRAADRLFSVIYPQLHRLAARGLAREPYAAPQTTELAHEAYLKLAEQKRVRWQNRQHFFAIAARVIRRTLIDQAKYRNCAKRGDGAAHVPVETVDLAIPGPDIDLLALDEALDQLARHNPEAARVVELRYFSGLSIDDVAEVMGIGRATVVRTWRFARAWLGKRVAPGMPLGTTP